MPEKVIHIRRKEIKSHLPSKVMANAKKVIGSVYKGNNPLGLEDRNEEKEFLVAILGIEPTERNYSDKRKEFWSEFRIIVPSGGVLLDVSTYDEEGKQPVNMEDTLRYKWVLNHPLVANSKEEMLSNPKKLFYIHDPEAVISQTNIVVKNRKLAYKEFYKMTPEKMRMILKVLEPATNIADINDEMIENKLDTIITTTPKLFLDLATDADLDIRFEIKLMVEKGILRQQGASVLYMDTTIGDSLAESISYFKNDRNSEIVLDLRSKLKAVK